MIRELAVLALSAIVLAACSPQPAPDSAQKPSAEPYLDGPVIVGLKGVGPIRATTYFEAERIQALFPKAQLAEATLQLDPDDPKDTLDVITVNQDGREILEVDDGTRNAPGTDDPLIGQVRVMGAPARGPHGEVVGMGWNAARLDLSQCETGSERERGELVCAHPHEGSVTYIFDIPGWDAADLPPPALLHRNGVLRAIVWTSPTTRGPS